MGVDMRRIPIRRGGVTVLGALVLQLMSSQAQAALTYINPVGGNGNERCLISTASTCAGGRYEGGLSIITVLEKDIGMGSFTRVDDEFDRLWANTVNMGGQVLARARYANDRGVLGYDAGGGNVKLINPFNKNKVLVSNESSYAGDPDRQPLSNDFIVDPITDGDWTMIPLTANTPFAFILRDTNNTKTQDDDVLWSSNNGTSGVAFTGYANSTNRDDHMVAFRVNDVSAPHYIIAWEDSAFSSGADRDYNDFVAELKFVMPVPVPAALLLLGSALLGLGGFTRRPRS